MRKDITIAKVSWGVRDIVRMILLTAIIPMGIFLLLVGLSHFGLLPSVVRDTLKHNDFVVNLGFSILVSITEIALVFWLVRKYQLKLSDIGLRKFSVFKAIGYVLAGLIIFMIFIAIVFAIVSILVPAIDVNQAQDVGFEFGKQGVGFWFSFAATVILAPIVEEIYFRGLILPALCKRYGWLWGVLGSSAFFAVLHFQLNVIIYTFILGLILSFFYIRLKSIIPGIVLHMINNAFAFIVLAGLIK